MKKSKFMDEQDLEVDTPSMTYFGLREMRNIQQAGRPKNEGISVAMAGGKLESRRSRTSQGRDS